jgi:uncharacterized membrane protein
MSFDLHTVAAILTMALVTYGTRLAGIFLAGRLDLSGRPKAAFDAIPAAVLVSVIAPVALATGPAETTATVIAGISATRLPLLATIAIGVMSVVLLRMVM